MQYGPEPEPARTPAIDREQDPAGALLAHPHRDPLGDRQRAEHVDLEHATDALHRNRAQRAGLPEPGVADVHVDIPSVDDVEIIGIGDVELGDGELGMVRGERGGLLAGLDGGDHRVTTRCERDRRATAEATPGAGDENGLRHRAPVGLISRCGGQTI